MTAQSEGLWAGLLTSHRESRDPARSVVPTHAPKAAVLTCSDARVSPASIFDQPAGSLFVIRVAGNTPNAAAVASLDYAVSALGVELIIVLGHTDCGAVGAACSGNDEAYLQPVTSSISDVMGDGECPGHDHLAEQNVGVAAEALRNAPSPVGQALRSGSAVVACAMYDLATDEVRAPIFAPLSPDCLTPSSGHPAATTQTL